MGDTVDNNTTNASIGVDTVSGDTLANEDFRVDLPHNHPLYFGPVDTSGARLISFQLTGTDNYDKWNRSMRIALRGRNKLGLVEGTWKKEIFRENLWEQWERYNAILLSWLMNAVTPQLVGGVVFGASAHTDWEDLREKFDKMKDLWDEFEALDPAPCDCEKSRDYVAVIKRQKLYQFLMGLNYSYAHERSQILLILEITLSIKEPTVTIVTTVRRRDTTRSCWKIICYPQGVKSKKKGGAATYNICIEDPNQTFYNQDLYNGRVKETGKEYNGLYMFIPHTNKSNQETTITIKDSTKPKEKQDIDLWHKRLGHTSFVVLKKLFPVKTQNCVTTVDNCHECLLAKHTRIPFSSSSIKSTKCFDLILEDIWGPYRVPTFDGNKYFLALVDDFSRMTWLFLLKHKLDVCVVLKFFLCYVKTQHSKCVNIIRTNNGLELSNSTCSDLFSDLGMIH
ncbi:uncharacterized protein LOC142162018 [Nicotiana tabacum]|uniref:Uncharacterized protein LOC142162018 n=1 Tax=Nicotiana tabacum TaxID=4097 RepID=A0AC58RNW4_TOBAC